MRYLKALGLAAIAAMALTAVLGAGSASASVLCTTTPKTGEACGAGWHVDKLTLSALTSASLHSTGGALEATCTESSSTAEKTKTGSSTETATGSVAKAALTWGGCSQKTETLAGGELEVHQITGTDNGTVAAKGFEVTVVIAGVSCIIGFGSNSVDVGLLTGGHDPIMHINAVVTKFKGSFLCPSTWVFEGTYTVTNHTNLYVATS